MKHLQNPYLPVAILLLLLGFFGYQTFFDSRYSETEKDILGYNYHQNRELRDEYQELAGKAWRSAERHIESNGIDENDTTRKIHTRFKKQRDELDKIYRNVHEQYFEKPRVELIEIVTVSYEGKEVEMPKFPPKVPSSNIVTAFEEYIKKVSVIDSVLSKRYKNFVFEDGMTNEELEDFYFDTDDYLRAFHYSRFEAQLATMYYEDSKMLSQKYLLYPLDLKIEDIKVVPYVHYEKGKYKPYYISTMSVIPFDKETTRLIDPANIETKFDENGFIIIPKEFRKGIQKFAVKVPTFLEGGDTILTIKQDFDYLNKYYKDEN